MQEKTQSKARDKWQYDLQNFRGLFIQQYHQACVRVSLCRRNKKIAAKSQLTESDGADCQSYEGYPFLATHVSSTFLPKSEKPRRRHRYQG